MTLLKVPAKKSQETHRADDYRAYAHHSPNQICFVDAKNEYHGSSKARTRRLASPQTSPALGRVDGELREFDGGLFVQRQR